MRAVLRRTGLAGAVSTAPAASIALIYVGSYEGIWTLDAGLRPVVDPVPAPASTFLARHPRLPVVYACVEAEQGAVAAYSLPSLDPLGVQSSGGSTPIHLAVSADGAYLLVANWGDGSVAVLPLDASGRVSPVSDLVAYPKPAAHHVSVVGSEVTVVHFAECALFGYELTAPGRLRPVWTADAGPTGPRHQVAHPSGRRYVADEHSSTLSVYGPGPARVTSVPATALKPPEENHPSEVALSPDGRYVYLANRGADTIAVFEASSAPALLAEVPTAGEFPRHFAVGDGHLYVANERSNSITVLRLDDGLPVLLGIAVEVPAPTCVLVVP
jgi:6-phosphogluconolactonase (cycloisomerase 2 family)